MIRNYPLVETEILNNVRLNIFCQKKKGRVVCILLPEAGGFERIHKLFKQTIEKTWYFFSDSSKMICFYFSLHSDLFTPKVFRQRSINLKQWVIANEFNSLSLTRYAQAPRNPE